MLIKPRIVKSERYAIAVPAEEDSYVIIQTYNSLEQLETGYQDWRQLSEERGLSPPLPIELLDKEGSGVVLTELVKNS